MHLHPFSPFQEDAGFEIKVVGEEADTKSSASVQHGSSVVRLLPLLTNTATF